MPDTHALLPTYEDAPIRQRNHAMAVAEALRQAADRLERALRHERWGCSAIDYQSQAVPFLRAAGCGELADRLEDDPWGDDTAAVLAEVRTLIAAKVCPVFRTITGVK